MKSSDKAEDSVLASLSANRSPKFAIGILLGAVFLVHIFCPLGSALASCKTNFKRPPRDFFENVDRRGYVHIVRQIGQVLDNGEIPIHIIFRTSLGANSPYLGRNHEIFLIDAKIFNEDSGSKVAFFPCGWRYRFWVDSKNPTIWHGSAGWAAEVRGDLFYGAASCGKGKIVFNLRNGRIVSFHDGEREFQYIYETSGRDLQEVTIDGNRAIRVLRESVGSSEVTGLELPLSGQRLAFEREARMIVSKVSGQNIIAEQIPAISKVTMQDTAITYAFAQDAVGNPTIEVSNPEKDSPALVTFDAATGKVLRDGDWKFDPMDEPENPWSSVPLGRTNAKGQKEFYFKDTLKGEETILAADGIKTIKTRFTRGDLAGLLRTEEKEYPNGTRKLIRKNNYDENGKLFSVESNGILETAEEYRKRISGGTKERDPLKIKEKHLLRYSEAVNDKERERAVYQMALDLVIDAEAFEEGKKLLPLLNKPIYQFNIQFYSIDVNKDLSSQEKVEGFQNLMKKFPEQEKILTTTIQNYSK